MKRIAFVLLLVASVAGWAQEPPYEQKSGVTIAMAAKQCGAAVLTSIDSSASDFKASGLVYRNEDGAIIDDPRRPGLSAFARAGEKMMATSQRMYGDGRLIILLISSTEINAWSSPHWIEGPTPVSLVCIPSSMADFIRNEDELAFVIGHEIGHTVDAACRTRAQVTRENQTACELRADDIGYELISRMGYDGYAAAGYFGRWEMYSGELETGLVGSLHQMGMDHPITPKRIENMRRLLIEATKRAAR